MLYAINGILKKKKKKKRKIDFYAGLQKLDRFDEFAAYEFTRDWKPLLS